MASIALAVLLGPLLDAARTQFRPLFKCFLRISAHLFEVFFCAISHTFEVFLIKYTWNRATESRKYTWKVDGIAQKHLES